MLLYEAAIVGGEEGERWLLRQTVPWTRARYYRISQVEKESWAQRSTGRLRPRYVAGRGVGSVNGVVNAPKTIGAQYRANV